MTNSASTETTFYQDSTIQVTQSRFITYSKTYAMRNISSVHVFEVVKSRKLPIIACVSGLLLLFFDGSRVFGCVLLALGILALMLIKNEFAVRISTNSGEVNSVISKDREYIAQIVNALNEAIIHIG